MDSLVDVTMVVVEGKYCRKQTEMQLWRAQGPLASLGTFLVTMGHDWSHNIDRKTVSNNLDKTHAEQINCDSAVYNPRHLQTTLPTRPCRQLI